MLVEIEMNKYFCYGLFQCFEVGDYLVKEVFMVKLLGIQLVDKVIN